jgi:hypothetical protein
LLCQSVISVVRSFGFKGNTLKREEAVALLKELGAKHFIQPLGVVIEKRKPDSFQLKIKGYYDCRLIEDFVKSKDLAVEENTEKDCLIIFKP